MSEIDPRALSFVQEQSVGEWDDKTIRRDAEKLTALIREVEDAAYENAADLISCGCRPDLGCMSPGNCSKEDAKYIRSLKSQSA